MKHFYLVLLLLPSLITAQNLQSLHLQEPDSLIPHLLRSADFWKNSVDWEDGGFYTEVEQDGSPERTDRKSFTQCSRHAYGFSRAFMVSGDETYLDYAEHAIQFVYDHGWDQANGGWYFSSDKLGNPSPPYGAGWNPNESKWSFQQHYSVLGIGAMAEATRDPLHTEWLDQAAYFNDSLLWDDRPAYYGYYHDANEDWSNPHGKGFTATVDAITTWVLTKALLSDAPEDEDRLLAVADNIMDHLYESMFLPQVNFGFAESYSSNWELNTNSQGGSTGHVIKTAWCLARAYMIDPDPAYLEAAQYMIDDMMYNGGYDYNNGGLFTGYNWVTGAVTQEKDYWMLEQGVTGGLINYYLATDSIDRELNLGMADGCMKFFMGHLVDPVYGEIFSQTNAAGGVINNDKSDPFKGGYHNIELAYLAYVYSKLFVHDEAVTLYYRFGAEPEARSYKMTPVAVPDEALSISNVLLNGEAYADFDPDSRVLNLPAGTGGVFEVTYNMEAFVDTEAAPLQAEVTVFPNPMRAHILIQGLSGLGSVELYNVNGQLVRSFEGVGNGQRLSVASLQPGTYMAIIRAGGQVNRQILLKP